MAIALWCGACVDTSAGDATPSKQGGGTHVWDSPSSLGEPASEPTASTTPQVDAGASQADNDMGDNPASGDATPSDGGTQQPMAATDAAAPQAMPDAGETDPTTTTPASPALRLSLTAAPVDWPPEDPESEFSVSGVRELFVHSVWSNLTGEHRELRQYFAPSGDLYYQRLLPFSTTLEAPIPFEEQVSIPHAKQVAALQPNERGEVVLTDALAVAGTWISDRGMTGAWTLRVYLDNAETPNAELHFELVP